MTADNSPTTHDPRGLTQTELADLAGVSQMTVNRVVNSLPGVSKRTRDKVLRLARDHGYRLNTAARTMRTRLTGQIGVLVLDTPARRYVHSALFELIWGINQQCESSDFVTSLVRLADVDREDGREARIFREHLIDGVIVVNVLPDRLMEKVRRMVPRCVWLDTNIDEPTGCIRRDEYAAGRLAAEALVRAGHRKVVSLSRHGKALVDQAKRFQHYSGKARRSGAEKLLREAGVESVQLNIEDLASSPLEELDDYVRHNAGVMLFDVYEARRVAAVSSRFGTQWGVDCSIVCADDAADLEWWWPELARVRFDRIDMGMAAVRMMERMIGPDPSAVPSEQMSANLFSGSTLRSV